jgi:hypothetical protein
MLALSRTCWTTLKISPERSAAIKANMSLKTILAWLGGLDLFGLILVLLALSGAVALVDYIGKRFSKLTPFKWREKWLRFVGLILPGVLFWFWSPSHLFYPPPDAPDLERAGYVSLTLFVLWLAWPILTYNIGLRDGRKDVQAKLDDLRDFYDSRHP